MYTVSNAQLGIMCVQLLEWLFVGSLTLSYSLLESIMLLAGESKTRRKAKTVDASSILP